MAGAAAAGSALLSGVKNLAGGGKKHGGQPGDYHHGGGHPGDYQQGGHHRGSKTDLGDVLQAGQRVMQSGLLGRKAQVAGAAISVAQTDTGARTGGLLGTAAASGLMGHKGRMAAHAMGLGTNKGQGEIS